MSQKSTKERGYHHGDLKESLMESGVAIIQKQGLQGLTLKEVARKQGVSSAAVYRHYESKEHLLAAIGAQGFRMLEAALKRNLAEPVVDARIFFRQCVQAYIDLALSRPRHYELMFGGIIPNHRRFPELQEAGQSAFSCLLESIEVCQKAGLFRKRKPIIIAFHVWGTMHGFVMLQISGQNPLEQIEKNRPKKRKQEIESYVGLMVQLLRRGLDTDTGRR
ncbi:MAG: TetR/AcrR family transcriptional regulator [Leptospiraceae bacterium]|nr:TetR/AcrR family transcriptional regulator [Leptospiraceae bacterium]